METRDRTTGHQPPPCPRMGTALLTAGALFLLLALWLTAGTGQAWAEDEARATPTPATSVILRPDSGMPHTTVEAEGHGFPTGSRVALTWDEAITLTTKVPVAGDGSFVTQFEVPEDSRGYHTVRAVADDPAHTFADAVFRLIIPTRTPTPTPTITPTPTWTGTPTWTPWPTNTPVPTNTPWPTNTPLPTPTPTMKPTLRPITPIYPSPTPYVPPATPTPYVPPPTPTPYVPPPTATSTLVPIPTPPLPTATATVYGAATATATPTAWVTAVTPVATPTPRATPAGGLAETGGGGGYFLLWGGALLLVVTMVAARWLRSMPAA